MELLDASCAHDRLPLSVVVILRGDMAQLVALGKHGVRQRVQRQCPCTVSLPTVGVSWIVQGTRSIVAMSVLALQHQGSRYGD